MALLPAEPVESSIRFVRGQRVLLDADLARLYGVTTGNLNKAVSRNRDRFPADFMFQIPSAEFAQLQKMSASENLMFQSGISSWGGRRTRPYAFTEHGVAMLSSVLRSKRAIAVNIAIMRAFVRLRQLLTTHKDLARQIEELDGKFTTRTAEHDEHISRIYDLIEALMTPPEPPRKGRIGFRPHDEE